MRLPPELLHEIFSYISTVKRLGLPQSRKQRAATKIWTAIFKDDIYLSKLLETIQENQRHFNQLAALPALLGPHLDKIALGETKENRVVFLPNDNSGDLQYFQELFFKSLRKHTVNEDEQTVTILKSGVILYYGLIGGAEKLDVSDPKELFTLRNEHLCSSILYYNDDNVYEVSKDNIFGLQGIRDQREAVAHACNILLRFPSGLIRNQVVLKKEKTVLVKAVFDRKSQPRRRIIGFEEAREWELHF